MPSFHKVTFPSPQLTARIFPANDQLTRHTASEKWGSFESGADGKSGCDSQGDDGVGRVCMRTVRSCQVSIITMSTRTWDAEAMYMPGRPMFGAQATSRTQSSCPRMTSSSIHFLLSSSKPQIRIRLSDPAVTKRFVTAPGVLADEGAHDIAFTPVP